MSAAVRLAHGRTHRFADDAIHGRRRARAHGHGRMPTARSADMARTRMVHVSRRNAAPTNANASRGPNGAATAGRPMGRSADTTRTSSVTNRPARTAARNRSVRGVGRSTSVSPDTKRSLAIAGLRVVGGGLGAEYVGAQLVAGNRPAGHFFDGDAARRRNPARLPVGDVLRENPKTAGQFGLRAGGDCRYRSVEC